MEVPLAVREHHVLFHGVARYMHLISNEIRVAVADRKATSYQPAHAGNAPRKLSSRVPQRTIGRAATYSPSGEMSLCDHPAITMSVPAAISGRWRRHAPTVITASPARRTTWAPGGMCLRTY